PGGLFPKCRGFPWGIAAWRCDNRVRKPPASGATSGFTARPSEDQMMRNAGRQYGTVDAARRKEMTGLAFVQGLASGALPHNTMAGTLGYEIVEAEKGRVVVI